MIETDSIRTEVEQSGGCRRRLSVTIEAGRVAHEFEEIVRRFARTIRLPGFRRGKVPPALALKRFSHEIEEEARDHLVREGLREGFSRHSLMPLHDPVIEGGEPRPDEPYTFAALFEVRPEVVLGEYKDLSATVQEPIATDEDVSAALDQLRGRLAKFAPVEGRSIQKGDFVLVDLEGKYEDGTGSDFKHEGVMIEVGSDGNLPEFEAALPGKESGAVVAFPVEYPREFEAAHLAGRKVHYTLRIREIKVKELPPLDDELPKDLGREGTLAELRDAVRADILETKRRQADRQVKESLLRTLIDRHAMEVPEVMVEDQVNGQIEDIIRGMVLRGINPTKTDVDWKEVRERQLPLARQRVIGMLLLDEIARKEALEATDGEVEQRLREIVRAQGGRTPGGPKGGGEAQSRQALKYQLLREKSLDFLAKNARISNPGS